MFGFNTSLWSREREERRLRQQGRTRSVSDRSEEGDARHELPSLSSQTNQESSSASLRVNRLLLCVVLGFIFIGIGILLFVIFQRF